jgi:hypothetical protein
MNRLTSTLRQMREERRALGWRRFLHKRGWRFVALVVAFYLVRDVVLYVLIPLAIAMGITR